MGREDYTETSDYISAQQADESDQLRVQRAEEKRANARTPFGRVLDDVSLRASRGDLYDSQEHLELIEELRYLKALDTTTTE